jgi:FkbM family methyltransferase
MVVRMSFRKLRRGLLHHLAKVPTLYRWILRAAGRGTIERKFFLQLIRRGDTVFDVGANVGYFTILYSDLVGPHGSVHSFEPVPPTFAMLNEKVRCDGRYRNVVTNPAACSEVAGTADILLPGGDIGQASMRSHGAGSWVTTTEREKFSVPTIRLDDYVAEQGLTRLDFIKCDAEGAELLVLKGAAGLLRQFEPILHLEVSEAWTRDFGYSPSELAELLESSGYSYFLIEEETVLPGELRNQLGKKAGTDSVNLLCACASRAEQLRNLKGRYSQGSLTA